MPAVKPHRIPALAIILVRWLHRHAVVDPAEIIEYTCRDILAEEMDGAVGHAEVRAAGMVAAGALQQVVVIPLVW